MLSRLEHLPFAVDQAYAASLLEPKLTEKLFRAYVGISRYVTPAAALLATYASYAELVARRSAAPVGAAPDARQHVEQLAANSSR